MLLIKLDMHGKFSIYNGAYIHNVFILNLYFNLISYIHIFTSLEFILKLKKLLHLFPKC